MNHRRQSIHARLSSDFHTYGLYGIGLNRAHEIRAVDQVLVTGQSGYGARWGAIRLSLGRRLIAAGRWCAGAALDAAERAEAPARPQSA